jgi:hypothetical protein
MVSSYQKRIVVFLDILGFKNIVENTDYAFSLIELLSNIKDSKKKLLKDISEDEIEITWFSDCIVISAPLNIYYLHFTLEIVQQMQSELIQNQVLIRGGISIGDCYHKDDKLFGPAMNNAYRIESEISNVPRVLLGEEVIKYIELSHTAEEKMLESQYTEELDLYSDLDLTEISDRFIDQKTTAQLIFEVLILRDRDGFYFVNYLDDLITMCIHTGSYEEEEILNLDGSRHDTSYENYKEFIRSGYEYTIEPLKDFITKNLNGKNMNVLLKYTWLKEYYNNRIENYSKDLSEAFLNDLYYKYKIL